MEKETINKEISDALHMLLHCALKDKEFETQKEQFYIIYDYIKELEEENKKCHKTISSMRFIKNTSRYEDTFLMDEELCVRKNAYKIEVENGKFIDLNELYNVYKNSIPTSVIQKKIEEVNNSNGYSPVNKIFIEKVLNEILEEGRNT